MKKALESVKQTASNINGLENFVIQDINALIFSRLAQEYLEDNDNFILKYDEKDEENLNLICSEAEAKEEARIEEKKGNFPDAQLKVSSQSQILFRNKGKKAKVFQCPITNCFKQYKSRENLNLHVKNIHEATKPYKCRFCAHTFSHRNGKTYHERKFHINYLPYKCIYQGKNILKLIFRMRMLLC